MGTRHLTMVVVDQELVICQYGQWDGYPTGQGITVADFIRSLGTSGKLESFADACRNLHHATAEEIDALGPDWKEIAPQYSRNMGAEVLKSVAEGKTKSVFLMPDFVNESLFCEYAYLLDLDAQKLEIYQGFQKEQHTGGRFSSDKKTDGYYPIKAFGDPVDFIAVPENTSRWMGCLEESMSDEADE